jgi:hypothetical protein
VSDSTALVAYLVCLYRQGRLVRLIYRLKKYLFDLIDLQAHLSPAALCFQFLQEIPLAWLAACANSRR